MNIKIIVLLIILYKILLNCFLKMSYNLLNNFKLAFDKALKHFKFIEYSYQLIDNNIYLHINFNMNYNINYIINYKLPLLHIKITTRSLYVVDSLYLALFQTITQYIQKYIRNFNYLSYVYNQNNDILGIEKD